MPSPDPQTGFAHPPEAENVRCDLAGNPLPSAPVPVPASVSPVPPGAPAHGNAAPAWGGAMPAPKTAPSGAALYVGLGVAALVLLGLIFGLRAMKPVPIQAPAAFKNYTALDNTFSCDAPAGWEVKESGAPGGSLSQVTFKKGSALFHVVSDAAGSLMADVVGSANANLPPEKQKPPVEKLHELDKKQLADSVADYQEQPAQKFQSVVGDARVSEWTAAGDGSGKDHGYRVTMLGKEREITVICSAPEQNWAALQPAFRRMINSIAPGNG